MRQRKMRQQNTLLQYVSFKGTSFELKTLINFVNDHYFKVETANLLGNQQRKVIFAVAESSKLEVALFTRLDI